MLELMDGAVLFAAMAVVLTWLVVGRRASWPKLVYIPIAIVSAFVLPPVFLWLQGIWRSIGVLPEINGTQAFIAIWSGALTLLVFERKGQPRRVPFWMGIGVGILVAIVVPPLLDLSTGRYQPASLRADQNACLSAIARDGTAIQVSNSCEDAVSVGLCLPSERNPTPCRQFEILPPNHTGIFETEGTALASVPANPNGFTLVACRPQHRPSRDLRTTGRV